MIFPDADTLIIETPDPERATLDAISRIAASLASRTRKPLCCCPVETDCDCDEYSGCECDD